MKIHTALLLSTIAGLSSPLLAQKHTDKPPLTLVLMSDETKVSLGTDVFVKIVWTNTSKVELNASLYRYASGLDSNYTLDLRDSGRHSVAKRPPPATFSAEFGTLAPGHSMVDNIDLSRVFDLSHPGDYTLQVSRQVPKELGGGVIKSNTITITITPRPAPTNTPRP